MKGSGLRVVAALWITNLVVSIGATKLFFLTTLSVVYQKGEAKQATRYMIILLTRFLLLGDVCGR